MRNGLVPHPHMVVEYLKGYLSCRGPCPGGARDPSPTPGSSAKKRSPRKTWLWKLVGILAIQVKWKAAGNPNILLKGLHTDSLTHRYSPWAPAEGQQLRRGQRHTGKDWVMWLQSKSWRVSHHCPFVESSSGAACRQAPSCLYWALPLHGQIRILIGLVRSTCSTPPNSRTAGGNFIAVQPALTTLSGEEAPSIAINGHRLMHLQRHFRWQATIPGPSFSISWTTQGSLQAQSGQWLASV